MPQPLSDHYPQVCSQTLATLPLRSFSLTRRTLRSTAAMLTYSAQPLPLNKYEVSAFLGQRLMSLNIVSLPYSQCSRCACTHLAQHIPHCHPCHLGKDHIPLVTWITTPLLVSCIWPRSVWAGGEFLSHLFCFYFLCLYDGNPNTMVYLAPLLPCTCITPSQHWLLMCGFNSSDLLLWLFYTSSFSDCNCTLWL